MLATAKRVGLKIRLSVLLSAVAASMLIGGAMLLQPAPAEAHCDSVNGPVVNAAREALDRNDVKLVLPYVHPESEAELTQTFVHTQEVRKLGGEAQELADQFFFETAVRLHRMGEGAAYTGLKLESDFGPALREADIALETGSVDEVQLLLEQAVKDGIARKFEAVIEAREHAAEEGTVAANRERAESELVFEKYVLGLYEAASGNNVAPEGSQAAEAMAGHAHQ